MAKNRPPMEQLLAAGREARRLLKEKGIESKDSVLDAIMKTEGSATLPGIPAYLPHQWTIKAAQRIMYDLILLWKDECKDNEEKLENISLFYTFVIEQLRAQEREYAKEEAEMPKLIKSLKQVPVLKDVFSPTRKKENINAIQRFFVDSFAVAIIVKNNHSTSEYANWFVTWSQELYALWMNPSKRDETKI